MSTIVTRDTGATAKGSALTNLEMDTNLINLNTDKIQSGNTVNALTITTLTTPDLKGLQVTSPDRHSVRPSLLLDFANTKQLDPRITFTRASTATFYDGRTTAKAEENLLLRSQEFDNGVWGVLGGTLTANAVAAPDGTTTAESFATNTGNARIVNAIALPANSIVSGNTYTLSIFAQNVSGSGVFRMYCAQTAAGFSSDFTATSVWQRFSFTFTANATGNDIRIAQVPTAGDLISVWGAQLEQRSTVTAYTPTTTAPITNYIPALQTAASGVARFDHNPTTGESLGLLIEEQRVNLLTYSEDFSNAAWDTKDNVTIQSNVIIAPDGTLTADKLVENTSNNAHRVYRSVDGTSRIFSFYAKSAGRQWATALTNTGSPSIVFFDLINGVLGTTSSTSPATIQAVGNGWYRCTIFNTHPSFGAFIGAAAVDNNQIYTGDGFSGIYIWGAQLEQGAFATSYIPTVASQVTRSPDAATMTGTNFTSWFNQAEGTLYAERENVTTTGVRPLACFFNTGNNYMAFYRSSGITSTEIVTNGASTGSIPITSAAKASFSYLTNNINSAVGGTIGTTDTSCIVPVIIFFEIGSIYNNLYKINGCLKKIAYYPKQLTNAELQGLTTV